MKISADSRYLNLFEALASPVRLEIIQLLATEELDVKQLASELGLSSAIMTMHVKKLEEAGVISSRKEYYNGATHKVCTLVMDHLEVEFPRYHGLDASCTVFSLPVGHYTDFLAHPTCGLATASAVIGGFDDPRAFLDPARMQAGILWLCKGFVEYRIPNHLPAGHEALALEITMELGSEALGYNNDWPSDLFFFLNSKDLGTWLSPGDFGGTRGACSPGWWGTGLNQYGTALTIRIDSGGTFMNGHKTGELDIAQAGMEQHQWVFRIAAPADAPHPGGLTIFGSGFGNRGQDMEFRLYHRPRLQV